VYVLKHRGPRKRTCGRSNPEARQKLDSPETADRRLPGTDPVDGGNTALGDGQWSAAAMPRTEPSATGTQVPGSSARSESGRAIGAALRSPGSDGFIRRKPMGLWDETPTAAQAAVGVSVCGAPPESRIVLETDERARLVADLLTELAEAVPGSAALLR
jgi:hypothetical protein